MSQGIDTTGGMIDGRDTVGNGNGMGAGFGTAVSEILGLDDFIGGSGIGLCTINHFCVLRKASSI